MAREELTLTMVAKTADELPHTTTESAEKVSGQHARSFLQNIRDSLHLVVVDRIAINPLHTPSHPPLYIRGSKSAPRRGLDMYA